MSEDKYQDYIPPDLSIYTCVGYNGTPIRLPGIDFKGLLANDRVRCDKPAEVICKGCDRVVCKEHEDTGHHHHSLSLGWSDFQPVDGLHRMEWPLKNPKLHKLQDEHYKAWEKSKTANKQ